MTTLTYLAPAYRDHPDAAAFCEALARHLPGWAADLRDYAWDAPVPPRDEWEREAEGLARHLESLWGAAR
jgi:hypothetical protein